MTLMSFDTEKGDGSKEIAQTTSGQDRDLDEDEYCGVPWSVLAHFRQVVLTVR